MPHLQINVNGSVVCKTASMNGWLAHLTAAAGLAGLAGLAHLLLGQDSVFVHSACSVASPSAQCLVLCMLPGGSQATPCQLDHSMSSASQIQPVDNWTAQIQPHKSGPLVLPT